jgi:hypothetical protein
MSVGDTFTEVGKVFKVGRTSPIVDCFRKWTGLEPTPDQIKLLREAITQKYHKILISAGRQSGKTLCSAVIVLYLVFYYDKPLKILLISAQDNMIYFHMRAIFRKFPELQDLLTEKSKLGPELVPIHGFETLKGSVVNVKNATDRAVMGFPADVVVIDEACKVSNQVMITAMGNLTGEVAKYIILSTPDDDKSNFVVWYGDPDMGFRVYTWSSENLQWHDASIEAMKKKTMTPEIYATQVLGRPKTAEERSFFATKNIDEKCLVEGDPKPEGGATTRLEVGIDHGFNYTVYVLTERVNASKRIILFYKVWEKKNFEEVAPEIGALLNIHKPFCVKVDSKPVQDQHIIEKYTRRTINYIDLSFEEKDEKGAVMRDSGGRIINHKNYMIGQLRSKVRNGYIKIFVPEQREVAEQLRKYRPKMSTGDDLVDALALSCYEPAEPLIEKHSMVIGFDRPDNHEGTIVLKSGRVIHW